jgi:hypothetical protein
MRVRPVAVLPAAQLLRLLRIAGLRIVDMESTKASESGSPSLRASTSSRGLDDLARLKRLGEDATGWWLRRVGR